MKTFPLWILALLCACFQGFSQTHTPVSLGSSISGASCSGFYRYLPADYSSTTKNYPLILWLHGAGQVGNGSQADLVKILEWGTPKIISEGGFPPSFTVGDSTFSFIVISPQFTGWPSANNVAAMINYAKTHYRVDPNRIYLMGISAGGGGVWNYCSASTTNSNTVAAVIPFCGTTSPTSTLANRIAAANLPVWAFHNTYDGTVPVSYSRNWINYMNAYSPAPNPAAKLTEFATRSNDAVTAHESWSLATLPTYKPNGINIYEWLLQYRKRTVTVNALPSANAGLDQGVVAPDAAVLNGSGSNDPDGIIVSYRWRKTSGPASYSFADSTLAIATVNNLVQGTYTFELRVTDNLGAVSTDAVSVTVYPTLPAGTPQRVLIDVGSSNANGGTQTNSPALNGNVWNNMTDARPGVRISNAITVNNQLSGIILEVINRVDGTYSTGSTGMGQGNNAVIVGDYPASATTDHALIQKSATNGLWRLRGLDSTKVYTVKFWGARTNTTAARTAEIKLATDNVWKSYNATSNTNYNNAASFIFTGVASMDFNIRTHSGSDFSAINVVDISYIKDTANDPPPVIVNAAPVARAGLDSTIQLPADSAFLRGCSSTDPENALLKYKWRKISGPASFIIANDSLCSTKVSALQAGTYLFELAVTDTGALTGKDSVQFTVNAAIPTTWPPQVSPLCLKPYKIVILGSSTAYGIGANPLDSSWARKYRNYLQVQNAQLTFVNLASPGFTSWHVSPTGFSVPSPFYVDTERNISKALSLMPDAIVLSLPSNDVALGVALSNTKANYQRIVALAEASNIPVWVTTTQPRNGLSASERTNQMLLRDWINTTYGNRAVDFWTTVANADGTVNPLYGSGDGVHLNNLGHHILFTRIVAENVWDSVCIRRNIAPVAHAGSDTSISGVANSITLHGETSLDTDGSITQYQWVVLNNNNAMLTGSATATPGFMATATGLYLVELTVTDDMQKTGKDTVRIQVYLPNIAPHAIAGRDSLMQYPGNYVLNGSASFDSDGSINSFLWQQVSGAAVTIQNAQGAIATVSLLPGAYVFSLTVQDDSLATGTDSLAVFVNAPPLANAGVNIETSLPAATVLLSGLTSTDADGTITKYRWRKISGAGTAVITDSAAAQTSVRFSAEGNQQIELTVTDNSGAVATDTVQVTVLPDPNIRPTAIAGADVVITLPANTAVLNGAASYDADGNVAQYSWTKISGATAAILNAATPIATATFTAAGVYRFELMVTDNLGAVGRDTVQVTVNADPNTAPIANAGTDIILQLPANSTALNGASSADAEAPIAAYSWTRIGGASTAILSNATQAIASVVFAEAGTYTFRLLVTDAGGLTDADTVTVAVLPVPELSKKIKVNVYGGSNPFNNPEWNNWNILSASTSPRFKYHDGILSNAYVTTTAAGIVADNGTIYGASATVCPQQVLRYNSANTSLRTLTFYGMNKAKLYDLEFYAARSNTGNSTVFIVNNRNDTISTSNNVNDYAKFAAVSPDASGRIIVNMRTIGTWNYLAGFMLTESDPPATIPSFARGAEPADAIAERQHITAAQGAVALTLQVSPNPASNFVNIALPQEITGHSLLRITDVFGVVQLQFTVKRLQYGNSIRLPVSGLRPGVYFVSVSSTAKQYVQRLVIK